MDEARRAKYENLMNDTAEDIKGIDEQMERELAEVKLRLAAMQAEREAQMVIYEGYCRLLGVPNMLAGDDDIEDMEE